MEEYLEQIADELAGDYVVTETPDGKALELSPVGDKSSKYKYITHDGKKFHLKSEEGNEESAENVDEVIHLVSEGCCTQAGSMAKDGIEVAGVKGTISNSGMHEDKLTEATFSSTIENEIREFIEDSFEENEYDVFDKAEVIKDTLTYLKAEGKLEDLKVTTELRELIGEIFMEELEKQFKSEGKELVRPTLVENADYYLSSLGVNPYDVNYEDNEKALNIINMFKENGKLDSLFDYLAAGCQDPFDNEEDYLEYVADTDVEDYETYNGKLEEVKVDNKASNIVQDEEELRKSWEEELKNDLEDGESLEQRKEEYPFEKWLADLEATGDFEVITESTDKWEAAKYKGKEWGIFDKKTRAWVLFGNEKEMKERAKELNSKYKNECNDQFISGEEKIEENKTQVTEDLELPELIDILTDATSETPEVVEIEIPAEEVPEETPEEVTTAPTENPMVKLAKYLISAEISVKYLHHNLIGGDWFEGHEKLGYYQDQLAAFQDDVIEQILMLGGQEPTVQSAIEEYPTLEIQPRNKQESFSQLKMIFDTVVSMIDEAKEGLPADVISRLEDFQNYLRKEADYKVVRNLQENYILVSNKDIKKIIKTEAKIDTVKKEAEKEAIATGYDQYVYRFGEDIFFTKEKPTNTRLLNNGFLTLGRFRVSLVNGEPKATWFEESKSKSPNNKTLEESLQDDKTIEKPHESECQKEINDKAKYNHKVLNVEGTPLGKNVETVAEAKEVPEHEKVPGEDYKLLTIDEFKAKFKKVIDGCYEATYGKEVNKDLYDSLAEFLHCGGLTGGINNKDTYKSLNDKIEETPIAGKKPNFLDNAPDGHQ